jgi:hypothetical protein
VSGGTRARVFAVASTLVVLATARTAFAVQHALPQRVALSLPHCSLERDPRAIDERKLAALLRMELLSDGIIELSEDATSEAPIARIAVERIACSPDDHHIIITISARLTGKTLGKGVDLEGIERDSQPRFVALMIAELLRSSWPLLRATCDAMDSLPVARSTADHTTFHGADLANEQAGANANTSQAERSDSPSALAGTILSETRAGIGVQGHIRVIPAARTAFAGPSIQGIFPIAKRAELHVGARMSFASYTEAYGGVALGCASGYAGLALASQSAPFTMTVGPRLELGGVWARGTPTAGDLAASSGSASIFLTSIAATLRAAFTPSLHGVLEVESGVTLVGADFTTRGEARAAYRGPYLGMSFGMGWTL